MQHPVSYVHVCFVLESLTYTECLSTDLQDSRTPPPPTVKHCYLYIHICRQVLGRKQLIMAITSLCTSVLTEPNKCFGIYGEFGFIFTILMKIMIYVKLITSEWPKEAISHVWNSSYALNSFSNWPEVERISGMRFRYQLHPPPQNYPCSEIYT